MKLAAFPVWRGESLAARLLRSMLLPMIALAALLGVGGALVIRGSVETVNDRILGAASRAIAESLSVEDGEIALNLSPAIFGMLEDSERDNVYYSVRQGRTRDHRLWQPAEPCAGRVARHGGAVRRRQIWRAASPHC